MRLTGNRQMAEVETEVGLRRVEKVSRLKGESQCPPRGRAGGEAEVEGIKRRSLQARVVGSKLRFSCELETHGCRYATARGPPA